MNPEWRHRLESIAAFALGLFGGAGLLAVLVLVDRYRSRPRCPDCGRRMRPA